MIPFYYRIHVILYGVRFSVYSNCKKSKLDGDAKSQFYDAENGKEN